MGWGAELKAGQEAEGEPVRPVAVGMPRSQRSKAMAGKVGVAGGGEEGQGAVPVHSSMQHASGFT